MIRCSFVFGDVSGGPATVSVASECLLTMASAYNEGWEFFSFNCKHLHIFDRYSKEISIKMYHEFPSNHDRNEFN